MSGAEGPRGYPAQIGKYRIDGIVGRGAVGVVFKGYDEAIDRPVAIKTLRPDVFQDLSANREALARFAKEVRSAGRCSHPNIVTVYDYVEHDAAPYIVMEYLSAGTLDAVTRSGTLLPVPQVGEIMLQLLFALEHAHGQGVVHRDIKPANILCPTATTIKVSDFGVAHIETLDATRSSGMGSVGTPNYMAPERFLGQRADGRSDLFSAGVILFQLLTGAKPYIATDLTELMRKVTREPPPHLGDFRPELPDVLDQVVQRALARSPDSRYQSASDFVAALQQVMGADLTSNTVRLDLTKLASQGPVAGLHEATQPSRSNLNHTMAERLDASTVDELGRSLARSLGPMARIALRQALLEATDVDTLIAKLAPQIGSDIDTASFRRSAETTLRQSRTLVAVGSGSLMGPTIEPAVVEAAAAALLPFIGPLARILANREAKAAHGLDDFYRRLSEAIPKPDERQRFLAQFSGSAPNGATGRKPRGAPAGGSLP